MTAISGVRTVGEDGWLKRDELVTLFSTSNSTLTVFLIVTPVTLVLYLHSVYQLVWLIVISFKQFHYTFANEYSGFH